MPPAPLGLYIDDLRSCLVRDVAIPMGYLHHHCQAFPGTSGSPVFLVNESGELSVIALHISGPGSMLPDRHPVTGNEATLLPVAALQKLIKS